MNNDINHQADDLGSRAFNLGLFPLFRLIHEVSPIEAAISSIERAFDGSNGFGGLKEAVESPAALKKVDTYLNLVANSEEEAEWLKDSEATYQMFRDYIQERRERLDALDYQLEANAPKFREGLRSDLKESHQRRKAA